MICSDYQSSNNDLCISKNYLSPKNRFILAVDIALLHDVKIFHKFTSQANYFKNILKKTYMDANKETFTQIYRSEEGEETTLSLPRFLPKMVPNFLEIQFPKD